MKIEYKIAKYLDNCNLRDSIGFALKQIYGQINIQLYLNKHIAMPINLDLLKLFEIMEPLENWLNEANKECKDQAQELKKDLKNTPIDYWEFKE